jgi:predicted anti-sigma-YlaC factor YlaD
VRTSIFESFEAFIVTARYRPGAAGRVAVCLALVLASAGCSLRSMAVNVMVPALANPAVYLSEEDPELVRDALPFLLKTIESLLESEPDQAEALLFACTGFALYASAFLSVDAELAEWDDYEVAEALNRRVVRMYVRARDYGLRRIELDHPGITELLRHEPASAMDVFGVEDVETLYYLGGAWSLAIVNGFDQPSLIAEIPVARGLLDRALALDETYSRGALHAAFVSLEGSVPEAMGGSPQRAREHFARAVELSAGLDAGPYVALASSVVIANENRDEFVTLLETALAIDTDAEPGNRLLNLIAQKRAASLLEHIDDLFFEPLLDEGDDVREDETIQ